MILEHVAGTTPETDRAGAIDESVRVRPAPALRSAAAWYSGYRQVGVAPALHRGLPSPFLTVIFTLDDPLTIVRHADPAQPGGDYPALLGGLHTAPAFIRHDGRQAGIQVALDPLAARRLLGLPAGELASLDVEAEAVFGRRCAALLDRLQNAATWPERFAACDAFLQAAARPCGEPAPEVAQAWSMLRRAHGRISVAELAAEVGWSERHLGASLRRETGLAPKAAARVIRFDHARRMLTAEAVRLGACPNLADLAARAGYSDQAHLAREFGALAGCPPTVWLAEQSAQYGEFRNVQAEPDRPPAHSGTRRPEPGPPGRHSERHTLMDTSTNSTTAQPETTQPTAQTPPKQVWPALAARDARALIAFLTEAFGFLEVCVYGEGDHVAHAELAWPEGGGIMLGSVARDPGPDSWGGQPGTFGGYVVTDHPDELCARARKAGAAIFREPHETDYGSRDFAARDPEGNRWSFGTYRGEPHQAYARD